MLERRGETVLQGGEGLMLIYLDSAKQVVWEVRREAWSGLPRIVGAKSRLPHNTTTSKIKGEIPKPKAT